ncbi:MULTISPECIES: (Fe-S)-binding protein [Methanococcoides]|uniref:(Fe-S)-binding protein n=1 Tax=Methanococcoides seepicolus TaxID=2828780 RepID=A0A9E4ZGC6_9EURY|nr:MULTISPECIES: (Fe-S)-binding protein [Methanococcoides]MCM1986654.1 (Fe-S)-binding protein [Methanococcoides seepicolus]
MDEDLLAVSYCIDCGKCYDVCHIAKVTDNKYTPRSKIMLLQKLIDGDELDQDEVDDVYLSTRCGACDDVCPMNIPITDIIQRERTILAEQGKEPARTSQICKNIIEAGSPGRKDATLRNSWINDEIELSETSDVAYMTGCWIAFAHQDIARSTIKLLNKAGITPRAIPEEKCCGLFLIDNGHMEEAKEYAKEYVEYLESLGIKKIIASCPGCYIVLKEEYARLFREPKFEVVYSLELFRDLIQEGKLVPKALDRKVAIRDACAILEMSDIPREILRSMQVEVKEMFGGKHGCCGGPAGVKPNFPEISSKVGMITIEKTKDYPDGVVSYCPFCYHHLEDVCRQEGKEFRIKDITGLLLESVL